MTGARCTNDSCNGGGVQNDVSVQNGGSVHMTVVMVGQL